MQTFYIFTGDVRSCLAAGKLSSKSSDGLPVFFVSLKKAVSYKHDNVHENTEKFTSRTKLKTAF